MARRRAREAARRRAQAQGRRGEWPSTAPPRIQPEDDEGYVKDTDGNWVPLSPKLPPVVAIAGTAPAAAGAAYLRRSPLRSRPRPSQSQSTGPAGPPPPQISPRTDFSPRDAEDLAASAELRACRALTDRLSRKSETETALRINLSDVKAMLTTCFATNASRAASRLDPAVDALMHGRRVLRASHIAAHMCRRPLASFRSVGAIGIERRESREADINSGGSGDGSGLLPGIERKNSGDPTLYRADSEGGPGDEPELVELLQQQLTFLLDRLDEAIAVPLPAQLAPTAKAIVKPVAPPPPKEPPTAALVDSIVDGGQRPRMAARVQWLWRLAATRRRPHRRKRRDGDCAARRPRRRRRSSSASGATAGGGCFCCTRRAPSQEPRGALAILTAAANAKRRQLKSAVRRMVQKEKKGGGGSWGSEQGGCRRGALAAAAPAATDSTAIEKQASFMGWLGLA